MDHAGLLDRVQHLDHLIEVYGDVLIAWQLQQPPVSVVPVLAETGRLETPQIEALLEEILSLGGAWLVAELESVETEAGQSGDPQVWKVLDRVRQAMQHTARHNADALVWSLPPDTGERNASSKRLAGLDDVRAFLKAVARMRPPAYGFTPR